MQGPVYRPPPVGPPSPPKVTQIWDGQIQAPPLPWYKRVVKRNQPKNYQRSERMMQ
jgi:hypothetical protein